MLRIQLILTLLLPLSIFAQDFDLLGEPEELAPTPVTENEALILEQWNTNLWVNLDQWSTSDPMNARLISAFKTLYYQSYARFEDYYLDRKFSAKDARSMALMTLFTVVGYHVERFF